MKERYLVRKVQDYWAVIDDRNDENVQVFSSKHNAENLAANLNRARQRAFQEIRVIVDSVFTNGLSRYTDGWIGYDNFAAKWFLGRLSDFLNQQKEEPEVKVRYQVKELGGKYHVVDTKYDRKDGTYITVGPTYDVEEQAIGLAKALEDAFVKGDCSLFVTIDQDVDGFRIGDYFTVTGTKNAPVDNSYSGVLFRISGISGPNILAQASWPKNSWTIDRQIMINTDKFKIAKATQEFVDACHKQES